MLKFWNVYSIQPFVKLKVFETEVIESATQRNTIWCENRETSSSNLKLFNHINTDTIRSGTTTCSRTRSLDRTLRTETLFFLLFLCINTNQVQNLKHSGHLIWTKELSNNASWTKAHLIKKILADKHCPHANSSRTISNMKSLAVKIQLNLIRIRAIINGMLPQSIEGGKSLGTTQTNVLQKDGECLESCRRRSVWKKSNQRSVRPCVMDEVKEMEGTLKLRPLCAAPFSEEGTVGASPIHPKVSQKPSFSLSVCFLRAEPVLQRICRRGRAGLSPRASGRFGGAALSFVIPRRWLHLACSSLGS